MSDTAQSGPEKHILPFAGTSTAVLTIDLAAIGHNRDLLCRKSGGAECAAVVKADAYGTGMLQVAPCLRDSGCKTFFVATPDEGLLLREQLPDVRILILDGLLPGCAALYCEHNLSPVLNSPQMVTEWIRQTGDKSDRPPVALHLDTGMNRLGIGPEQIDQLLENEACIQNLKPALIMSHLACADDPTHSQNRQQLRRFHALLKKLPGVPVSLANSAGIFLGADYHFDLTRPGIALYGGCPANGLEGVLKPVAFLSAPIIQIRDVAKGETVGYGADYVTTRRTRLATLPVGYADGYPRSLGSGNDRSGASAFIGDYEAPLLGRVSMDLVTIDITDIPENIAFPGAAAELLGHHIGVDDLARIAGTIGYEILTSLGARYERRYIGGK